MKQKKNKPVDLKTIQQYEAKHKITIPEVYKKVLQKHNGASLNPLGMEIKTFGGFLVEEFYSINAKEKYLDIAYCCEGMKNCMPPKFFPFGNTNAGDTLLIGTEGKYKDKIYLWFMEGGAEETNYYGNIYFVAKSWNDFILSLREEPEDDDHSCGKYTDLFDKGSDEDIIKLIDSGWDVNTILETGQTALQRTSSRGRMDIARMLLDKGANTKGAIEMAMNKNNYAFLEFLLTNGADIEERDEYQNTPLHISIMRPNIPLAKFFLDHNADVNAKNDQGRTALGICKVKIRFGYKEVNEVVPLIIAKGGIE